MKLSYHDIMNANFGALLTAAEKWRAMGNSFGDLRTQYTTQVKKKLEGWKGDAASSYSFSETFILGDLSDAKKQARAVAELLENAHDMFVDLRGLLKEDREAAVEQGGMKVDEYGKCTLDTSKLVHPKPADPVLNPGREEAEKRWTASLQAWVPLFEEVDELVMKALKEAVDGEPGGVMTFNPDPPKNLAGFAKKKAAEEAAAAKRRETAATAGKLVKVAAVGVRSALKASGDPTQKLLIGAVEGAAEATGYNNTQGVCMNVSGGAGVKGIAGETCLVTTRKPGGGSQFALTAARSSSTAGFDSGVSWDITAMKSNADDVSQLEGPSFDKSVSYHQEGVGGSLKHGYGMGTENSKGEKVNTFGVGAGPGAGFSAETGLSENHVILRIG